MGEAAVGERAQHPEQDLERGVRARREVQRERGQRGGERVDRDAGEHDRQEVAAPAREPVQRREREQRAADGAERQQQRRGARDAEVEDEHGAERRAARGAEQPGLGERIAQQALQRGAAQAQRSADEQGEQRARQADLAQDDLRKLGPAEAERRPAAVAPDDQRYGRGQQRPAAPRLTVSAGVAPLRAVALTAERLAAATPRPRCCPAIRTPTAPWAR